MTTIVIDLYNNQWLALLGAFLLGGGFFCLVTWPFVASRHHRKGYEERGRERPETQFNIEALRRNAEALRAASPW